MRTAQNFSWLKFVDYSKFDKWFVSYYINPNNFDSTFSLVELRNVISPIKNKIRKIDYKKDFPVVKKISFADGVIHLRDELETNMDLYALEKGDLLVSKINFHQGALAINTIGKLVCTTHYQPYHINRDIVNDKYLVMAIRSQNFKNHLSFLRAEGIKNEATYEFISSLLIPLPPLSEQQKIVEAYERKINDAQELQLKAQNLEADIEKYLFEELGISLTQKKNSKVGLQFVSFKDIERWDAMFLMGQIDQIQSKYKVQKFSKIISSFNRNNDGKSIRVDSYKTPDRDFRYIGMENIEKGTGKLLELQNVKGLEIKSQTLNVPPGFLIYGKLRPYLNKYWINETDFENIICSSEFFVFDIEEKVLDKYFFKYVLASKIIQTQISDKTSGARMPRINEEIFFNLKLPMPEM
ncbi:restriction endonuclease subunit S [Cruoricaptor ignavus]|uniref:restriction endonuclease subunit S n=1 Tax=Cruoricaptor ignavus TaxID=1118202 RepID=UPI00370DD182